MNPYRESLSQPKIYSRIYVMLKSLREMISSAWRWLDWENAFFLLLSFVILSTILFTFTVIFCATFLPHTFNGCYVSSTSEDNIRVYRDVSWEDDPVVHFCKGDLNCAKEIMSSDLCKQ